jgi:transglutaminase-like putative cysteine protease
MTTPPESATQFVRVGCDLEYRLEFDAPVMFALQPRDTPRQHIMEERRLIEPMPGLGRFKSYLDQYGNTIWRMTASAGRLRVTHDLIVEVSAAFDPVLPDLRADHIEHLPDHVIVYTLPSRYCESDKLASEAWERFGNLPRGWAQVQAICDHLHGAIPYRTGSTFSTSALEAYRAGHAVCRDFAHMAVAFCRALSIPARYVCGYLPDIGVPIDPVPMDFHAWFEAYLEGAWRTFDARHNRPRTGRVVIATGRDAADTAFSTTYGATYLERMRVWALPSETAHLTAPGLKTSPA